MGLEPNTERDIFVSALRLRFAAPRNAYLETTCGDRPGLLNRIEALLAASEIEDTCLAAAAMDGRRQSSVAIWTVQTRQVSEHFASPQLHAVHSPAAETRGRRRRQVTLSASGVLLAVGEGGRVRLWDTASWQLRATWQVKLAAPWFDSKPVLSPDRRVLLVGGFEGLIHLVDLLTGETETA